MTARLLIPTLLPFLTALIQWKLWHWIGPYAWILFFPTMFLGARFGGFRGGLVSTIISAGLVWYFFIPPQQSWVLDNPFNLLSVAIFLVTGYLVSAMYERLQRTQQSTEAQFEATFEQAAMGIALVLPDGRWKRVNRKLCQVVGYSEEELLAITFQDITHPDDLEADLSYVRQMLAGDIESYTLEKRYIRKDGRIIWVSLTVALVWKAPGQPDYFISMVEDIQARKEAEEALKESEAVLTEAQHLARIGNWKWDYRADIPFWSEELYHLFGRDPALPPANSEEVPKFFTLESWERLSAAIDRCIEAGIPYGIDAEIIRPDGGRRWVLARGEPTRDDRGKIVAMHGTIQDITERKQAEASLRASEERLQLFIRYAPASLAMFDSEMRYLAASRRWMDDYFLDTENVIGKSHYELFPNVPEGWKEIHRRGLAGEVVRIDEDCFERRDGSRQWLRWEVRPWHSSTGTVGGIVIFAEDITRYKLAQEEIQRLNADLERRVAERTAELTAANQELDSFAYAVSHDLRAPLRAMSGFSQLLEENYGARLEGDGPRCLHQIRLASRKMSDLIDGILALSRITRGDLRCDEIDLSAMAERLLEGLAASEPDRKVGWEVESGLVTWGDARMMESVMSNLLDNAWKYTSKTPAAQIRVYRNGDCFCIADNGAGFDGAQADKLFQPFRRLHGQNEFPGIGIGLATVQRIIQRHGGRISATGTPGQGATFCFSLDGSQAESSCGS